jgi:hypothetical protein
MQCGVLQYNHMKLLSIITVLALLFIHPVFAADTQSLSIEKYYFKKSPVQYEQNRLYVLLKSEGIDYEGKVTILYSVNGSDTTVIKNRHISIISNDHVGIFADVSFLSSGEFSLKVLTKQENSPLLTIAPAEKTDIKADTDRDGIANDIDEDDDNDGLTDEQEKSIGTSPTMPDTDGDGITDNSDKFPTNKNESIDTDQDGIGNNGDDDDDDDGLTDADESKYGTNPVKPDSDNDGISDAKEIENGTNPIKRDSDNDGVPDNEDIAPNDPTTSTDTDKDGLPDGVEDATGLDPNDKTDAQKDNDNDAVSNSDEILKYRTNPNQADTDSDGISDGIEVKHGLNPKDKNDAQQDNDGDGVNNVNELSNNLNPNNGRSYLLADALVIMLGKYLAPIIIALTLGMIILFSLKRKKDTRK